MTCGSSTGHKIPVFLTCGSSTGDRIPVSMTCGSSTEHKIPVFMTCGSSKQKHTHCIKYRSNKFVLMAVILYGNNKTATKLRQALPTNTE